MRLMRAAVGSRRQPKVAAVRATLAEIDPDRSWQIEAFETDSGVRETPLNRDEIRLGARRRVENLTRQSPGFDLYVGMEGGLESSGDDVWLENWAYASDGVYGYFGSGGALPLPPSIIREVLHSLPPAGHADGWPISQLNLIHRFDSRFIGVLLGAFPAQPLSVVRPQRGLISSGLELFQ